MNDNNKQYRTKFYTHYISKCKRRDEALNSSDYERWSWSRACAWRIRGWLPPDKSARVLDVGCGVGNFLHTLSSLGYQNIEGVDVSEEQVQIALKRHRQVYLKDAAEFLTERPRCYDFISAFDLIEHLTRNEAIVFIEAARDALNRGAILLQLPNADAPGGMATFAGDLTHEQIYSPGSLTQLLESCGFKAPQFREAGPVPLSFLGIARTSLWQVIRTGYILRDLVETGVKRPVYTRVMLALAWKKI